MNLNYAAIGKRIKLARMSKDITQEQLAEMVNLSLSHVSNIENANSKIGLQALVAIANALDTPVEALLADSVVQSSAIINQDIQNILSDCSEHEIKVLARVLSATKDALRETKAL